MEKPLREYRWPDARDELEDIINQTTPLERLEWVEEVLDLAYESGALARAWEIEDETRYRPRH